MRSKTPQYIARESSSGTVNFRPASINNGIANTARISPESLYPEYQYNDVSYENNRRPEQSSEGNDWSQGGYQPSSVSENADGRLTS